MVLIRLLSSDTDLFDRFLHEVDGPVGEREHSLRIVFGVTPPFANMVFHCKASLSVGRFAIMHIVSVAFRIGTNVPLAKVSAKILCIGGFQNLWDTYLIMISSISPQDSCKI